MLLFSQYPEDTEYIEFYRLQNICKELSIIW